MDDAVPQWVLYSECVDTNDGAGEFLNTGPTAWIRHLRTFISSPDMKKNISSCQEIPITWWCQAWGASVAVWSGSHLLSTGFWEMDLVPRQVSRQTRWLIHSLVFSLEGRAWQEPEPIHVTGMALAHCVLGTFLGSSLPLLSPPLHVPTLAARCLRPQRRQRS